MSVAVARRLPRPVVAGWLAVAAVLVLALPVLLGVAAVHAGSTLLRTALDLDGAGPGRALTVLVRLTDVALVLALAAKVRSVWSARRRRADGERLLGPAPDPALGEVVLVEGLGVGSRRALDRSFAELADWFTELEAAQHRHPGLALVRTQQCSWVRAALLALDAAALTAAAAPRWAPPHTSVLLDAGTRCLHTVTTQLGLAVPGVVVSLHGREEHMFADTVHHLYEGGLAVECSLERTWSSFQERRVRYAPHAAALNEALGHRDYTTAGAWAGDEPAARLRLLSP